MTSTISDKRNRTRSWNFQQLFTLKLWKKKTPITTIESPETGSKTGSKKHPFSSKNNKESFIQKESGIGSDI